MGDSTFERIVAANKTDAVCTEFRNAIAAGKESLLKVRLAVCRIVDGALFKEGLLWVPEELRTDLLKEIHDQCSTNHPGQRRMLELPAAWSEIFQMLKGTDGLGVSLGGWQANVGLDFLRALQRRFVKTNG